MKKRKQKIQKKEKEGGFDSDDDLYTASITKRQPPRSHDVMFESHDQSTRHSIAGGRPYTGKGKPVSHIDSSFKIVEESGVESSVSIQYKKQERRHYKRQRTIKEDISDSDDDNSTSFVKRQPLSHDIELELHDQSTKPRGKGPAGGRPYKRKRRPVSPIDPSSEIIEESGTKSSVGTQYKKQKQRQYKRHRRDEEDSSDSDDNTTSLTKQ